jgi:hypothetical protein
MAFGVRTLGALDSDGRAQPAASTWETFHERARTFTTTPTVVTGTECAGHVEATSPKA